jgi:hypothetical protein
MANTVLTILVIAIGVAADVGALALLARPHPFRRKEQMGRAVRVLSGLGILAAVWVAIPLGGYYVCALLTVPGDGYAAGWLLFFTGFAMVAVGTNRIKHRRDLKRLEAGDDGR